ncbi:dephospho-CoA kinase [Amphritea sp. HPY]|uniref:dephospho-CoA kinase n=1 Tax=Amphritea sp. HPY TaxID=3421652 RepID=UPI003D7D86B7
MFVVGLTGGIGSGKSALSRHFEALGILVIDADQVAREVVEPGESALSSIVTRFGAEALLENGSLDRRYLREVVFAEPKQRNWLEQLLHPIIRDRIMQKLEQSDSRYTILSSPLLLETDQHLLVNHIIVVDAPEAQQIERTMARDSSSEEQVRAIIAAQMERSERIGKADDLVDNSGSENDLQPLALALHEQFLKQAQQDWEAEH